MRNRPAPIPAILPPKCSKMPVRVPSSSAIPSGASYHGETDAMVRAKALAARRAGLLAIVCVGETRAERDAGKTHTVVRTQLDGSLPEDLRISSSLMSRSGRSAPA